MRFNYGVAPFVFASFLTFSVPALSSPQTGGSEEYDSSFMVRTASDVDENSYRSSVTSFVASTVQWAYDHPYWTAGAVGMMSLGAYWMTTASCLSYTNLHFNPHHADYDISVLLKDGLIAAFNTTRRKFYGTGGIEWQEYNGTVGVASTLTFKDSAFGEEMIPFNEYTLGFIQRLLEPLGTIASGLLRIHVPSSAAEDIAVKICFES